MVAYTRTTISICRVLLGLAVLWVIVGLSGRKSWADDSASTHATLRGIEGIAVVVESLKPEVERAGLTKTQLQTDVELRLRHAGIRILTQEERLKRQVHPGYISMCTSACALIDQRSLALTLN